MARTLRLVPLLLLLLTAGAAAAQSSAPKPAVRGDVNLDGQITAADALAILSDLVGKQLPAGYALLPNGDTNGDGDLSAADALVVLSYAVSKDVSQFPVGRALVRVLLGSDSLSLVVGQSQALQASVQGAQDPGVTWRSSASAVATVDAQGMVTAVAPGEATITAVSKADTSSRAAATVRVAKAGTASIASLSVSPSSLTLQSGWVDTLKVSAKDAAGDPVAGAVVSWSSSDSKIASVGSAGVVTAVAPGSATITATAGGKSARATVTVAAATSGSVASLSVGPSTKTLASLGDTVRLAAGALDGSGKTVDGATIAWKTSSSSIAVVNGSGLVTAKGNGTATITASSGGKSATAKITVAQKVASLAIQPDSAAVAVGASVALSGTAKDARGNLVAGATYAWSSAKPAIATVDSKGTVKGVAVGSTTVTLFSGGRSASAIVRVTAAEPVPSATVATVEVTPGTGTLTALGAGVQLAARALDAGGDPVDGLTVAWNSSDSTVAAVNATGYVTAKRNGTATITASAGGKSGAATITVLQAAASLVISPDSLVLHAPGETGTLSTAVKDANGNAVSGCSVAWSSNSPTIAEVSSMGSVIARAAGFALITASCSGVADTVGVNVHVSGIYPAPTSIDTSGTRDVTDELNAFFASVPDGSTVEFPVGAKYRIEGTLQLNERNNLIFQGHDALFFATVSAPYGSTSKDRVRSHWRVVGGSNIVFRNVAVKGANPNAGTSTEAYVVDLEAQHGFDVQGVDGLELDHVTVTDVYGDFVYLSNRRSDGKWSTNIHVHDSYFDRNGRQGFAFAGTGDVLVEHNYIGNIRRTSLDLEPYGPTSGVARVTIRENTFGPARLNFFSAASNALGVLQDITVEGNELKGQTMGVTVTAPLGIRHSRIHFIGNTSDSGFGSTQALMTFTRVDGILVRNNYSALSVTRSMVAVRAIESCEVVVSDNQFPGASTIADIQPYDCPK